jgi:hypothetical protein
MDVRIEKRRETCDEMKMPTLVWHVWELFEFFVLIGTAS